MKSTLLTASATLVVGLAAGWMLKPDPTGATSFSEAHPAPERPETAAAAKVTERADAPAPEVAPTRLTPEDLVRGQQATVALQSRKAEARRYRLAEALGLDGAQKAQLDEIVRSGTGDREQRLRSMLSDEQARRLDEFKERDKQSRIDAFARSRMARLDDVDLDADQREAVTQRFRDLGRNELDGSQWNPFQPTPIGGSDYQDVFEDPQVVENPEQIPDRLEDVHEEQNAETFYSVEDLLTPAQQEQLRTQLDALADQQLQIFSGTSNRNPDFYPPRQPR